MEKKLAVIIPAIKKNVAFPDDLVKKLAGLTLVGRAIDKAISLTGNPAEILLITDSEEISLIGERNGVTVFRDAKLDWSETRFTPTLYRFLRKGLARFENCILLSPYAPLLDTSCIKTALEALEASGKDVLRPVKEVRRHLFDGNGKTLLEHVLGGNSETHLLEFKGFVIFRSEVFRRGNASAQASVTVFPVSSEMLEINSFQDWWICEKLLQRKRIVFRIIGDEKVGMGHIYRALSLAHEITDHEVLFFCDEDSGLAANRLAGYDYWLGVYPKQAILENILALKPDMVINDILDTDANYIKALQNNDIITVNFEDIGSGARLSNLTVNELYDEPQFSGGNVLWGHEHFFVRDEFHDAREHRFRSKVNAMMLVFGGTDQLNLTQSMYRAIRDICLKRQINIHIVTGPGYANYVELEREVASDANATLTRATGVISSLMERCQVAITSNGRTVYELAHMNIPSIVIAQHDREKTHDFACSANGFIPVGIYEAGTTEKQVEREFKHLVDDVVFRKGLFDRTTRFCFTENKKRMVRRILKMLEESNE